MYRQRFQNEVLPLKDRLFRLALRITLNREDAEDVVQDTMVRLWDKRGEWDTLGSLEAFALTVCRNLALDLLKRSARRDESLDSQTEMPPATDTLSPHSVLVGNETAALVRQAMDGLPEVQRTIMLLRDMEGKSYDEIAAMTRLNVSQVKVYLHRARMKIKALLEES